MCKEFKLGFLEKISAIYKDPKEYFVSQEKSQLFEEYDTNATISTTTTGIFKLIVTDKETGCVSVGKVIEITENKRTPVISTITSANAEDGISCVQTAEGALAEVQDMLQRMNQLTVQAANGTNSVSDRQAIQDEVDQLVDEIDRISEFDVLTGVVTGTKKFVSILPASHFVTSEDKLKRACKSIREELNERFFAEDSDEPIIEEVIEDEEEIDEDDEFFNSDSDGFVS